MLPPDDPRLSTEQWLSDVKKHHRIEPLHSNQVCKVWAYDDETLKPEIRRIIRSRKRGLLKGDLKSKPETSTTPFVMAPSATSTVADLDHLSVDWISEV